jgi:hypothetical protein
MYLGTPKTRTLVDRCYDDRSHILIAPSEQPFEGNSWECVYPSHSSPTTPNTALLLAFDPAHRDAFDHQLLCEKKNQDDGRYSHAYGGMTTERLPGRGTRRKTHRDRQGHRLLRVKQHSSLRIIVPSLGKSNGSERGKSGLNCGNEMRKKIFKYPAPVYQCRFRLGCGRMNWRTRTDFDRD